MRILIVGGTGLIGSNLLNYFNDFSHEISVLSRNANLKSSKINYLTKLNSDLKFEVIINLAGENLNNNRWNKKVKDIIFQSRIETTEKIIDYIQSTPAKPKLLINASAIGFYGSHPNQVFTEEVSPINYDFAADLCNHWEEAAIKAKQFGTRVCLLRTGVVLAKNAGALKEMILPFKFGLGAKLGDGKQFMSWIHIEDVVGAIDYIINNDELSGPFNLTAPGVVTNEEFSKELALVFNKPMFLTIPAFLAKIIFGEMAEILLLKGQKVIPKKLINAGYKFKFSNLSTALKNILGS